MPRHGASQIDKGDERRAIHDALFQMEPQLKLLEGVLATLQLLGEASDAVDPSILAMLARCSRHSVDELRSSWQTAFDVSVVRNLNE